MNEQEALARMIPPWKHRPGKYGSNRGFGGVCQIHVTRACDKACFNCTQGSNLSGKVEFMSPELFEQAVLSLKGYPGIYGLFGGNPAVSIHFEEYCAILRKHVPFNQRGLWCNHPRGKGAIMAATFDPAVSNLNVHLDREAYNEFRTTWPGCHPVGLTTDSRHSPVFVAMKDVLKKDCELCEGGKIAAGIQADGSSCPDCKGTGKVYDESTAWELISNCDINQHWSPMIGVFRGELRAWFCEIAGAQSILHQHEPDYPDTGLPLDLGDKEVVGPYPWWMAPMETFKNQVRKHCHECSVPLRGKGELACAVDGTEQTSKTHEAIYKPKRPGRKVEVVQELYQIKPQSLGKVTAYLQNSKA